MKFIRITGTIPENTWYCFKCGSVDVEIKQWVGANTSIISYNENPEAVDCYCSTCEANTPLLFSGNNLLGVIDE